MTLLAVAIADLVQLVLVASVAGVGVTAVFALAIAGTVHAHDARRDRRKAASAAWGGLSLLAILVVGAAVLTGISILAG